MTAFLEISPCAGSGRRVQCTRMTTEHQRKVKREQKLRLRAKRDSLGVCRCCGADIESGHYCAAYLERRRAKEQRKRKEHWLTHERRVRVSTPEERMLRLAEKDRRRSERLAVRARLQAAKDERRVTREDATRQRQESIALGMCRYCAKRPAEGERRCSSCRKSDSLKKTERNRTLRLAGLCGCGRSPAIGTLCEECWFKERARGRCDWRDLRSVLVAQNFRCAYSGKLLMKGPDATVDHKTPRSRGGTDEISNLHWVSRRVNQMKTDFTHEEFIKACGIIAKRWQQNQKPIESALKLTKSCAA